MSIASLPTAGQSQLLVASPPPAPGSVTGQISHTDFQDCLSISGSSFSRLSNLPGPDGARPTRSVSSGSSVTYKSVLTFDTTLNYERGRSSSTLPSRGGWCSRCAACISSMWDSFANGRARTSRIGSNRSSSFSEPLLHRPEPPALTPGPLDSRLEALTVIEEVEEVITIDGNPAGLQRLVDVLVHNMGGDTLEDPEKLSAKLKMPCQEPGEFSEAFRQRVRENMTANDFRQMMYILENIFAPLRSMKSLSKVIDIFMNQWIVKIRPVAMNLQVYKKSTKKQREAARLTLTEEERDNRHKYELQYRSAPLRKLMDEDNDSRVVRSDGGPLSAQAVIWTKCIIEFMCSIFNLCLQVCPGSIHSISEYLAWVRSTGVHKSLPPPHRIFGDSNLHNILPTGMRFMVSTALRAARIGPTEIFSANMNEVFGDSIEAARVFVDNLRAITCLLAMLLEDGSGSDDPECAE